MRYPFIRAHPHSRGENTDAAADVPPVLGSSPLTRGKPQSFARSSGLRRLIPTHAGKTPDRWAPALWARAHPHSRGENSSNPARLTCSPGSSPLTRGKRRPSSSSSCVLGLIPTHAGKTGRFVRYGLPAGAHPHSRGENLPLSCEPPMLVGSSPLTRGKRRGPRFRRVQRRLIPTHAGKTATQDPYSRTA